MDNDICIQTAIFMYIELFVDHNSPSHTGIVYQKNNTYRGCFLCYYECEIRKLSKRTIKAYRNNNALFFTFIEREFGLIDLQKVTSAHIKGYVQFMMKKGISTRLVLRRIYERMS